MAGKNIFDAIKLIYYAGKFSGVLSYTIIYDGVNYKTKLRILDIISHVLLGVTEMYFLLTLQNYYMYHNVSILDTKIEMFQIFSMILISVVNAMSCQLKYKSVFRIYDLIKRSDELLENLGIRIDYNMEFNYSVRLLGIILLVLIYVFVINTFVVNYYSVRTVFAYLIVITRLLFIQSYFNFFLYDIKNRYKIINNRLTQPNDLFLIEFDTDNESAVYQKIVHIHGFLNYICRKINEVFGVYLTLITGFVFSSVVVTMYYNFYKGEFLSDKIVEQFYTYNWVLLSFLKLLIILYRTNDVSNEVCVFITCILSDYLI